MKVVPMKAERRTALGRNQVAQLRAEGWMPAVVYGEGKEAVSIAISEWELDQHVKSHHRVYQLDISGTPQAAFLQEVSWHAVSDRPVHADFKRIDLTKEIEMDAEVKLVGYPIGLGKGGSLMKDHLVLRVRCLPTEIPEGLEYDVSKVDLDEFVTASQVVLPKGVTLVSPPTMPVCHVAKMVQAALPEAPAAVAAAPAAADGKDAKDAKDGKDAKSDKPAKG